MHKDIADFHDNLPDGDKLICELLYTEITKNLPESNSKLWHGSPVWFIDDNPIVGYDKLKSCVRLLFWSGQSFEEKGLTAEGSFKASEKRYTNIDQVNISDLSNWLEKAKSIQWDYKNIVKRRGVLERLK